MSAAAGVRTFVFLQGPHGEFFDRLGLALETRGHRVFRVNLNGGDRTDWTRAGEDFAGGLHDWPAYIDASFARYEATDLLFYGDCRAHHRAARLVADARGMQVWVFEEGYIRPDWLTLEHDGVNGHSTLPQHAAWFQAQAHGLPPVPDFSPVPSSARRRTRATVRYYLATQAQLWRFPRYRSHRPDSASAEAWGWLRLRLQRKAARKRSLALLARIDLERAFLFPLQLNSDHQIRTHSQFSSMSAATFLVLKSFADHAPGDATLVLKRHPLDTGTIRWRRVLAQQARTLGIEDRVALMEDGPIDEAMRGVRGVVTVNSTVGTLSIGAGIPTAVLGRAVYRIEGLVHAGTLDRFWTDPVPPDPAIWDAVRRVLHDRCLVHGGLSSDEGIAMLVEGTIERLLRTSA